MDNLNKYSDLLWYELRDKGRELEVLKELNSNPTHQNAEFRGYWLRVTESYSRTNEKLRFLRFLVSEVENHKNVMYRFEPNIPKNNFSHLIVYKPVWGYY